MKISDRDLLKEIIIKINDLDSKLLCIELYLSKLTDPNIKVLNQFKRIVPDNE